MPELTMGSLFDGIGGFPLAAVRNGITPLWASEIEPFRSKAQRRGAAARGYHLRGQPVSGPLDRELHPCRFARRKIRTFYGADSADKGDERCRHTSRAIRSVCSTKILLLGKRTGRIQLNQEVAVTVTYETNIGLFSGFGSFPITLRADATGKSEVYWK